MKTTRRLLDRDAALRELPSREFDCLVIGGGATGLGCAVDAASRGYTTALVEAHDFAQGTSSRSTKLVHGGVRYLEQMDFGLVREALAERATLHENAPHLVHDLPFVVPHYTWWEAPFYGVGLKLYDALAGRRNLAPSRHLSKDEVTEAIPNVSRDGLLGGVRYHDGQFDDSRMAITLAQTAASRGAVIANRVRVDRLVRRDGRVVAAACHDAVGGNSFEIRARCIINATGIWSDRLRQEADPAAVKIVEPAQGVHLVFDGSFAPSGEAIMVPHTDDGRVLFVIPWHGHTLVGTTDTPMPVAELEPRATQEEIGFILRNAARYMQRDPTESDILCAFAGMRPLVHEGGSGAESKKLSRSHKVEVAASGVVSVTGGKWTTYRRMAQDTIDAAINAGLLPAAACRTETLRLHGAPDSPVPTELRDGGRADWRLAYGTDWSRMAELSRDGLDLDAPIADGLPWTIRCALWAVEHEMALDASDIVNRRTRIGFLNARAAQAAIKRLTPMIGG